MYTKVRQHRYLNNIDPATSFIIKLFNDSYELNYLSMSRGEFLGILTIYAFFPCFEMVLISVGNIVCTAQGHNLTTPYDGTCT